MSAGARRCRLARPFAALTREQVALAHRVRRSAAPAVHRRAIGRTVRTGPKTARPMRFAACWPCCCGIVEPQRRLMDALLRRRRTA